MDQLKRSGIQRPEKMAPPPAVLVTMTHMLLRFASHIPKETPQRWFKALQEMTTGYKVDTRALLKTFDGVGYDGMIVVGPLAFHSLCEHHLFPFSGRAWLGYLPNRRTGRIVGLSKLGRLLEAHARRFQVQERMTADIAADLYKGLKAYGVGVRVESQHTCMSARGVGKEGTMRTNTLLGAFLKAEVRAEFETLCNRGE
jgi:GTP cyclohydrolase I